MLTKTASAAVLACSLALVAADASGAAPLTSASLSGPATVQLASFWAKPYPYGYRFRITPCVRDHKYCGRPVRALGALQDPAPARLPA